MSTRTGSPEDPPPADPEELVQSLNALLGVLSLSRIRLETPQDLTPALLLGVLESMLRARLPVPPATRAARTRAARVDAMKVFLAVLQTDVLAEDVGLADVDPRRLADGEWDECVFVAELLVWLARDMAYLPDDDDGAPAESSGMAAARSAVTIPEPDRSTAAATAKRHAHKESVTSMRTADSNPFIVRPRPRAAAAAQPAHDPSPRRTYSLPQRSYSPPSPIPSSHPSRTPSPPNVTHTGSSLGLSFRPPRASSPARLPDDEEGEDTQLCTCDPDASFASSATFCTCSHAGDDDDHPAPPHSPPISRAQSQSRRPAADAYSRRPSLDPSSASRPSASSSRRISQPPASTSRRPSADRSSSAGRAPVRYDGWIARVEGDVEAFEAAHPPRPARRRPPALDPLYPTTHPSSYPSASAPSASASDSRRPSAPASALETRYPPAPDARYPPPLASPVDLTPHGRGSRRGRNPTRHVSPAQHTLALMAERARLLGELAALRRAR